MRTAILRPNQRLLCAGVDHRRTGRPQPLDLRATSGPTKVGLLDGQTVFCSACAWEIFRDQAA
jgi:hypothetical protein